MQTRAAMLSRFSVILRDKSKDACRLSGQEIKIVKSCI